MQRFIGLAIGVFLVICASLWGCSVAPSTLLVSPDGKAYRCATYGYGYGVMGAIAMSSAQNTHDKCVSDMERLGYIRFPEVKVGLTVDFNTKPFVIKEVIAPAADAGVKAGDCFLAIDGQAITSYYQFARFLNKKHAGDEVKVEVSRDNEVKVMPVVLISQ